MSEDYLDRRARMFERSPAGLETGTAAPGRPSPPMSQRINPHERILSTPSGATFAVLGIALREAQRYYEGQRAKAVKGVREAIQEQLEPGEEVRVYVADLNVWEGTFDKVVLGDPRQDELHDPNLEPMRVCGGGACGPQPGSFPQRRDFTVPTSSGPQTVRLKDPQSAPKPAKPPETKKPSPTESRPGRGEFRDWVDRWNRDPGLIDHDFDRADRNSHTA